MLAVLALLVGAVPAGAVPAGVVAAKGAAVSDGTAVPRPDAGAWLIGDLGSGEVFAGSDVGKPLAPASTIKLLTALTLYPHLDVKSTYVAREDDVGVDGTRVGMVAGAKYTVDQLFHALIMSSANDAAHALGNAVGGEGKAVAMMRQKAFDLGLTGTTIRDTSGLNDTSQTMTVSDMMIVAHAVVKVPYLMKLASTLRYHFPGSKVDGVKKKGFEIENHTRLVGEYPGALGLKNGYTVKAGGSYVAVAERGGRRLIATILHAKGDTRSMAMALLDWGFAQKDPPPIARVSFAGRTFGAPPQAQPTASAPSVIAPSAPAAATGADPTDRARQDSGGDGRPGGNAAQRRDPVAGSVAALPSAVWQGALGQGAWPWAAGAAPVLVAALLAFWGIRRRAGADAASGRRSSKHRKAHR